MGDMMIEVDTSKHSMSELKPALDTALGQQFPGGMLQRRWEGDTLVLSGPGAKGTITFEEGKLVGRARLGPPASMMKGIIEEKIGTAMKNAATAGA